MLLLSWIRNIISDFNRVYYKDNTREIKLPWALTIFLLINKPVFYDNVLYK